MSKIKKAKVSIDEVKRKIEVETIRDIFPDKALAAVIANMLEKNLDETVTQGELDLITNSLWASHHNIKNLEGMQRLTNLERLCLYDNQIVDITPLMSLINLRFLGLSGNKVTDLKPLKNLVNLKRLYLGNNKISDVTVLGGLKNLRDLDLGNNEISQITALGHLKNLTLLWLNDNEISDITAMSLLENLDELELTNNKISDISALSHLKELWYVILNHNEISDLRALKDLKAKEICVCNQSIHLDSQVAAVGTKLPLFNPDSTLPALMSKNIFNYNEISKELIWKNLGESELSWKYSSKAGNISFSGTVYQSITKCTEIVEYNLNRVEESIGENDQQQECYNGLLSVIGTNFKKLLRNFAN